jgi:hypothetical protein
MTDQTTEQRRADATNAFVERRHELWHQYNGADAACDRCGTNGGPAWLRRKIAQGLPPKDLTERGAA